MLIQAIREGGVGMFPTILAGILLLGVAGRYAVRPERPQVPLLLGLGTVTLATGALGFVTGVMVTFQTVGQVTPDRRYIALIGVAESLNNLAFALAFIVLAALAVSVGSWRSARAARTVLA